MLAYRLSRANESAIRIRNGGVFPEKLGLTTYFIYDGDRQTGETVTESDFFNRYNIITRLSRQGGRYVVESKTPADHAGEVQQAGKVQQRSGKRHPPHPGIHS